MRIRRVNVVKILAIVVSSGSSTYSLSVFCAPGNILGAGNIIQRSLLS